jgi:hypothetical protein
MMISRLAMVALLAGACSGGAGPKGGSSMGGEGGGPEDTGGAPGTGGKKMTGSTGGAPGTGGATSSTGGAPGTGGDLGGSGGATGTGGAMGGAGGSAGGAGGGAGGAMGGAGGGPPNGKDLGTDTNVPPPNWDNSPLTEGFTNTPFMYNIQSPTNVPQAERYTFDKDKNIHVCWVKSTDSSFEAGNGTDPRTELRWTNEWTSGQHMLDADVWIAPTTDRTNITQVFSTTPPTTFMLTAWKDRTLRYYFGTGNGPIIMNDAFGKWFNLKVLHNVTTHRVTVYINDVMSMSFADKGSHWHFKNGNYGCRSERCETHWHNLRYWVKN